MHCMSSTHTEIGIASICMLPIYLLYVCQTKELEQAGASPVADYAIQNTSDVCGIQ